MKCRVEYINISAIYKHSLLVSSCLFATLVVDDDEDEDDDVQKRISIVEHKQKKHARLILRINKTVFCICCFRMEIYVVV